MGRQLTVNRRLRVDRAAGAWGASGVLCFELSLSARASQLARVWYFDVVDIIHVMQCALGLSSDTAVVPIFISLRSLVCAM